MFYEEHQRESNTVRRLYKTTPAGKRARVDCTIGRCEPYDRPRREGWRGCGLWNVEELGAVRPNIYRSDVLATDESDRTIIENATPHLGGSLLKASQSRCKAIS